MSDDSDATTSALSPFDFEHHAVRVELIFGEPWFCGRDVGDCIGLTKQGVSALVGAIGIGHAKSISNGLPGRAPVYLSETGLYLMLMRSRKPACERFQLWLASDVLPSIRRTGAYSVAAPEPGTLGHSQRMPNTSTR